ncbi:GNAT family N-acetyltransferase [Niameybacter massiliensis]|uniref:GNAT family N-acetyltransferase n=1 Tax=Niameybacter massiliensis TaxID=1658108 RepID=UPI0006B615EF|nr:GNAT family N-acetyltransferase [Niameybacter massiliensis]
MSLAIRKVDSSNYEEILELRVAKGQESFIETTKECLKEASEDSRWEPVGIYDGDVPIGFAMYGLFLQEGKWGRVWLDRFLISGDYQRRGYGEASVKLLLHHLYKKYEYDEIYLSVYDTNKGAIDLYQKLGFYFNGELDINQEKVMVINYKEEI